ncbi:hypothetical protein AMTRI_Chr08g210300 [Amborella trichopoda]|uniref:Bromo domain-containing protein n=1 Tax=Amborella trichopoda TaxID=13333 RepID=W1P356_AMBTC|nr:uncharacterized protein LOC18432435 [Amborella trichopoda]ERN04277.1 hypothetical protein AMTR_s00077p00168670 [Amborella trichopoda]|eukprot:XP_020521705.1 uncharacterized protein LOC18432435 [Amborella trichopoda]
MEEEGRRLRQREKSLNYFVGSPRAATGRGRGRPKGGGNQLPGSSGRPSGSRGRGRKRRSLKSVVDEGAVISVNNTLSHPEEDYDSGKIEEHDIDQDFHSYEMGNQASPEDATPLPEKRVLELILDILQKKDTHDIFAMPVNGEEVEGYYDIIENPMDFGTMRAKLQEGMYETLEQFEKDVFLIFDNAMHFNGSSTVYYRQARAIQELAKKTFHLLRTDPQELEMGNPFKRGKPAASTKGSRKQRAESSGYEAGGPDDFNPTPSAGLRMGGVGELAGSRDGKRASFPEEHRSTYRPELLQNDSLLSTISGNPPQIIPSAPPQASYIESLTRFTADLGPTAKRVAQRKIKEYLDRAAALGQNAAGLGGIPATVPVPSQISRQFPATEPLNDQVYGYFPAMQPLFNQLSERLPATQPLNDQFAGHLDANQPLSNQFFAHFPANEPPQPHPNQPLTGKISGLSLDTQALRVQFPSHFAPPQPFHNELPGHFLPTQALSDQRSDHCSATQPLSDQLSSLSLVPQSLTEKPSSHFPATQPLSNQLPCQFPSTQALSNQLSLQRDHPPFRELSIPYLDASRETLSSLTSVVSQSQLLEIMSRTNTSETLNAPQNPRGQAYSTGLPYTDLCMVGEGGADRAIGGASSSWGSMMGSSRGFGLTDVGPCASQPTENEGLRRGQKRGREWGLSSMQIDGFGRVGGSGFHVSSSSTTQRPPSSPDDQQPDLDLQL